ncbi:MAG: hypothetical protein A2X49_16370 [Lentisphaerae bacterium GWF2_52_8]|nr:MAG: hypothetical protein A2X49_16370 [Lentisphaerae bacterium GWF2_52_8]
MKYSRQITASLTAGAALLAGTSLKADPPTPAPSPSQVQTHLKLEIKDETKQIHFINTNNDPYVFTKAYVLKHADPYEIRPYVRSAVQAYQVTPENQRAGTGAGKVEAVKYMDGRGVLIVSAEDYRFAKQTVGMGIDELIETLDQPNVSSASGHMYYLYFPKYWDANSLRSIMLNVGASMVENDPFELDQGKDRLRSDPGLNALFFYTPAYSVKTIQDMLTQYDTPTSEALVTYTIYELDYENDGRVGADFQAWKNGPGSDLFATGGRWTHGWDIANMTPATRDYVKGSHTEFINFNPKWNTKYLDFLASKGKAKVITSGALSLMNNTQGTITSTTRLASLQDGNPIATTVTLNQYIRLTDVQWDTGAAPAAGNVGMYRITGALDSKGNNIYMTQDDGTTAVNAVIDFMISRAIVGGETYYYMEIERDANAYFYSDRGLKLGKKVMAYDVQLQAVAELANAANSGVNYDWVTQNSWSTDRQFRITKSVERNSAINDYGFQMTLTPSVCENASQIDIAMTNTNLVGFQSNGLPRTSRSEVSTRVMVGHEGKKFVIGGLEKQAVVRSVDKVPYLGDIPILGWAFSSESEVTKKSQLVAVMECVPLMPDTKVPEKIAGSISEAKLKIENSGIKAGPFEQNDYGFDQFWLDTEKQSLDPLP